MNFVGLTIKLDGDLKTEFELSWFVIYYTKSLVVDKLNLFFAGSFDIKNTLTFIVTKSCKADQIKTCIETDMILTPIILTLYTFICKSCFIAIKSEAERGY